MHILFTWAYWQYPEVALEFLQTMRRKGHKISVLIGSAWFKEGHDTEKEISESGINLYFARKMDVFSSILRTPYPVFRNVPSYLKFVDPDVVHVNSHLFLSSYQVVGASHSMHIPSVVTVHGVSAERGFVIQVIQEIHLRTLARSMLRKASTVVCLTKSDAKRIAEISGSYHEISILPNGVDTTLFRPSPHTDRNLIVWAGRFVPEKGLIYLFKAMQDIAKENPKAKLILIGDGALRTKLVALAGKMGLYDKIMFRGTLSRTEVADILSRSCVFAFPSLREGMPLSVLEAMACGLPVVGFDVPGVKDLVVQGQTGLLVPPKNSHMLSEAILSLLENEAFRKGLSENARRKAIEQYSLETVTDRLDHLYHNTSKN